MSLFQSQMKEIEVEEDTGTFQQQALEINLPGANFDPNAVPTNGEEFLTFMAYERKNTPVVVSRLPAAKKLKKDTANDLATEYTASILNDQKYFVHGRLADTQRCTAAWKEFQLKNFKATRVQAHALRNAQFSALSMEQMPVPPAESNDWLALCSTTTPLLQKTLTLGQRDLEKLLEAICEWLQRGDEAVGGNAVNAPAASTANDDNDNDNDPALASNVTNIAAENLKVTTPWLGQWLYATLVCLNLPLEPFVHSNMREIVRIFVRQRALLTSTDAQTQQHINTYNIFIHIIAQFFGQLDFAEFI